MFFWSVHDFVRPQLFHAGKTLSARVAHVVLALLVHLDDVTAALVVVGERLAAEFARQLLVVVRRDVGAEVIPPGKLCVVLCCDVAVAKKAKAIKLNYETLPTKISRIICKMGSELTSMCTTYV